VFAGGFGDGADMGYAFNQIADIVDNDALSGVTQNNYGTFTLSASAGDASFDSDFNHQHGNPFGAAGNGDVSNLADAHASTSGTAFNMDLVLGANLQQNAADVTVVGGNLTDSHDDSSGSHH